MPLTTVSTAASNSVGMLRFCATWFAVPRGIKPSGTSVPATPVAASASVPSPPTTQTARYPRRAPVRASSMACPAPRVSTRSNGAQRAANAPPIIRRKRAGSSCPAFGFRMMRVLPAYGFVPARTSGIMPSKIPAARNSGPERSGRSPQNPHSRKKKNPMTRSCCVGWNESPRRKRFSQKNSPVHVGAKRHSTRAPKSSVGRWPVVSGLLNATYQF